MGLYELDHNYGLSTWYENNGAYDLWTGTDLMLDLTRHILDSDAYLFQGVAFPKGPDILVPINQTFSGTLNLTPFSYIVALTGWSANDNQFTLRIFDKGAQTDVYAKQFAWWPTVLSNMTAQANMGQFILQNDQNKPYGPYFFRDPLIVLPPGVLQIQLTNVSTGQGIGGSLQPGQPLVQMFFMVAVPKNTVSMATRKVVTVADPTGTQTLQGASSLLNLIGGN